MNNRGFAEVTLLLAVIVGLVAFFVPNPLSSSLGIGIRPNKMVQTEKVELIRDSQGVPIAYKTVTSDKEIQQHVSFFEWLRSLPILAVLFMGSGVVFPAVGLFLHKMWSNSVAAYKDLTGETKRIVLSVKEALTTIQDPTVKQDFLDALSRQQDASTKDLVKELLKSG